MDRFYDVVIVGGGPAGLTAALYLARARYRVLVLEKQFFGGQIAITEEVVNYPGIARISGRELTQTMRQQAEAFGATFCVEEAVGFELEGKVKTIRTDKGEYQCLGVLLATGAYPRRVGFQGEETWKGRGVAYCATCDGEFFTGKDIFVVGGGYAAAEESIFLTKFARHVTILIRKDDFSCPASVAQKAREHEKITVLTNTVLEEVAGENGLTYARYRNTRTGQTTEYRAQPGENFGVFVLAGYVPATEALPEQVERNEQGYIVTDRSQKTSIKGVYAAGDVCIKPLRQVVTATGDGALAATELEKYVAAMQEETGMQAETPPIREKAAGEDAQGSFESETRRQLDGVFQRMERGLILKLFLDQQPLSRELERFAADLAQMSSKIQIEKSAEKVEFMPCLQVYREDGSETGLAFHGIPGGHEFTSFVLGLYNAAGPGQTLEEELQKKIRAIQNPVDMKILVTLSCNMCPDVVIAAQRMAVENEKISAQVFDIAHFETLRNRYNVMSVPCLIINDEKVSFGKKNIQQILQLIDEM